MEDEERIVYLIFRIYDKPSIDSKQRIRYYGWSTLKNVIKAFLEQRDKSKYKVVKRTMEEAENLYDEGFHNCAVDQEYMINFIKLPSSKTDLEVTFLTTQYELSEAEKKIQNLVIDTASLESISGITDNSLNILELFINLKDPYAKALYYLGYRPKDLKILFGEREDREEIEELIDQAYEGYSQFPQEEYKYIPSPPGLSTLDDISNKILYSIEAFIKVLKEDL